jgi:fatty acid desaturase
VIQIDTSDRKEQRKFGVVVGIAFLLFGVLRWWLHSFEQVPVVFFSLGGTLIFFGLVAPPLLKPVFIVWIKLAIVLNWIMTRVFLSFAFVLMFIPVRWIIHFFGDDPLKRAYKPAGETYWEAPDHQPQTLEEFKRMF